MSELWFCVRSLREVTSLYVWVMILCQTSHSSYFPLCLICDPVSNLSEQLLPFMSDLWSCVRSLTAVTSLYVWLMILCQILDSNYFPLCLTYDPASNRPQYLLSFIHVSGISIIRLSFSTLSPDVFNYTFKNLVAGHGYLVSIVTKLSYKESDPVIKSFRTCK
jgi:uncharacterized protein involved in tolerance to divalent cations